MPTSRKPVEAAPPRMGPLAKLPVFLDLGSKRAVVAGGTAAAAWKAELIAAAGCEVHVFAAAVSPEMAELFARGASAGSLIPHSRYWDARVLDGAALAIADFESEAEAQTFAEAARRAGVPFNVIDKPEYCQFQFGSIVNRSPVVIGISTDGAAPILGQAIRRRIEAVLPASLAGWCRLAKSLRPDVGRLLGAGVPRRAFWERFTDLAFGAAPTARDELHLRDELTRLGSRTERRAGHVSLVGAGPGDAELLTLKAVRALQSADVVLYDDLVSPDVLELARREAKRICVGKRGHRASCRQDDISGLMVRLAAGGQRVVRLKSGDPLVFGRAGEEIERLSEAGIPFDVVPGITAASGMAARLGISLTHRDAAQSVRFVTAHGRHGALPDTLDWDGLADPATTLVVYMGGKTAGALARRLIDRGLSPSTPVVAVAGVSRPDEESWRGTLAELEAGLPLSASTAPVILGVGAVFGGARSLECDSEAPARDSRPIALAAVRQAAPCPTAGATLRGFRRQTNRLGA